ncbi:hypothetical protein DPMN_177852 [Dreissena polymorpha]|uniref:Uncharacterized protein n=1 Tax=Dreissena polymorpha TaxID=45954 RepID=A0A9D4E9S0_DREPO|nr:hypothetical protein DPMN_177852 [Dreissena polymorpha]
MLRRRCQLDAKFFVSLLLVAKPVFIYGLFLTSANHIANQRHYYLNPLEGKEFMNINPELLKSTIDTLDPKLIGHGKDLFKPLLKKVRHVDNNIVLFSAVAGNSSSEHVWDTIDIQGWENKHLISNIYKCCVLYTSGEVMSVPATRIIYSKSFVPKNGGHTVCLL